VEYSIIYAGFDPDNACRPGAENSAGFPVSRAFLLWRERDIVRPGGFDLEHDGYAIHQLALGITDTHNEDSLLRETRPWQAEPNQRLGDVQ